MDLNAKQQKFVDAVSNGVGHRDAALAAGYSAKSAHALASRLLNNVKVRTALEERQEYYRSIANVESAEVIGAYKEMALASIEDALTDAGELDFVKAKLNGSAKLIKKISRQQTKYGETVAVEFYSRTDALNQLSDILGLKQMPRANNEIISEALKGYDLFLAQNPNASLDEKLDAIKVFAAGGKVSEKDLRLAAGVISESEAVN